MATLVLSAAGEALGGPVGSAIGALVGQQVDQAIFAPSGREGPRLTELAASTSSYGQAIARHHGRVRAPGSIIWATDLNESQETSGGKGKPKTTTFSYSASLAVALASRPIREVRRIWADGNLLRGEAGDLKVDGALRIHSGYRDQAPDTLIAASEGALCPAFRGCAYAVFEDLQLADFGNRIPALTFEVVADDGAITLAQMIEPLLNQATSDLAFPELTGFTVDGGAVAQSLSAIDQVFPIAIDAGGEKLSLDAARDRSEQPIMLPPAASAWEDGDFGGPTGRNRQRDADQRNRPEALRYYDINRDFQPGLQRAEGRGQPGRSRILEFPAALDANSARSLANAAAQRASWRREQLSWRLAELDPALVPGAIVTAPGISGQWRIAGWEWRERGVELVLDRLPPVGSAQVVADAGNPALPVDNEPWPTRLEAFELPWDGIGSGDTPAIFAAVSAGGNGWRGAALYNDAGGELLPIGTTGRSRSTIGKLTQPLSPAQSMLFDPCARIEVELVAEDLGLSPTSIAGIARGANRLLVGSEIVQFASAEQTGPAAWRLTGLLRGRGGTEFLAQSPHLSGTSVVLIDNTLVQLDPLEVPATPESVISAIGQGDQEPANATLSGTGTTLRPLAPVHPRICERPDGGLDIEWSRRARGAWDWPDEVETPLVEQNESYVVGLGQVNAPLLTWQVNSPVLSLDESSRADLRATHSGQLLWVRQIGSYAQSRPLFLTSVS